MKRFVWDIYRRIGVKGFAEGGPPSVVVGRGISSCGGGKIHLTPRSQVTAVIKGGAQSQV
jgi:hypothetical protein